MTLSEVFTVSYPELHKAAMNITRRRNPTMALDLINDTYIHIHGKPYPNNPKEFTKWFTVCMNYMFISPRSNFGKNNTLPDIQPLDKPCPDSLNELELYVEPTNEATKDFIGVSSSMKKERAFKYIQILEFEKSLPLHEKELFDLYYKKGLSSRKITEHLNKDGADMHFKRINKMVNIIKAKIKTQEWK